MLAGEGGRHVMAKPYSMDLRERAMRRVQAGEPVRQVAAALSVAPSTVVKWSLRLRATGAVTPGKIGGHRPRRIVGEHEAWLRERASRGDFTLRGLVAELAERGLKVDYRTMWSFIRREGLSFKKKRGGQRAGPARHRAPPRPVEDVSG
jgi:putative transposase